MQGKALLTSFYGMDITRDKLSSLIRKWQTLIEASVDVKTTDGYLLRLFSIAFTKRRPNQVRKTSYAQSSQIRAIRKKMQEIMTAGASLVVAVVQSVVLSLLSITPHLLRFQRRPSRTSRALLTSSSLRPSPRRSRRRATASTLSRTSSFAR